MLALLNYANYASTIDVLFFICVIVSILGANKLCCVPAPKYIATERRSRPRKGCGWYNR